MRYENDNQVRDEIIAIKKSHKIRYTELAEILGTYSQAVHRRLHKNKLTLEDVKLFCDALDCDFEIQIRDRRTHNE